MFVVLKKREKKLNFLAHAYLKSPSSSIIYQFSNVFPTNLLVISRILTIGSTVHGGGTQVHTGSCCLPMHMYSKVHAPPKCRIAHAYLRSSSSSGRLYASLAKGAAPLTLRSSHHHSKKSSMCLRRCWSATCLLTCQHELNDSSAQ